jgi:hypothetical protein
MLREARAQLGAGDALAAQRNVAEVEAALARADSSAARAALAHRLAAYWSDAGALERAEVYARIAVEAQRRAEPNILLGNHLMFLAQLLRRLERYGEALSVANEGVVHYVAAHGEAHGEVRFIRGVMRELEALAVAGDAPMRFP